MEHFKYFTTIIDLILVNVCAEYSMLDCSAFKCCPENMDHGSIGPSYISLVVYFVSFHPDKWEIASVAVLERAVANQEEGVMKWGGILG